MVSDWISAPSSRMAQRFRISRLVKYWSPNGKWIVYRYIYIYYIYIYCSSNVSCWKRLRKENGPFIDTVDAFPVGKGGSSPLLSLFFYLAKKLILPTRGGELSDARWPSPWRRVVYWICRWCGRPKYFEGPRGVLAMFFCTEKWGKKAFCSCLDEFYQA